MSSSLDEKSNNNPSRVSEKLQILLLFFYGFGNAAAYLLCRTVADSEFLGRFGADRLPELYMMSAAVVALASIGYSYLVKTVGLKRGIVITLTASAVVTTGIAFLIGRVGGAMLLFAALYFVSQVRGSLATIQFATVLNEQYRSGPVGVVGIVGSGATTAGVIVGGIVSLLPETIAVSNLLLVAAFFDILTIAPLLMLRSLRKIEKKLAKNNEPKTKKIKTPASADRKRPGVFAALKSRYVVGITIIVCCSIMVTTVVEYNWKAAAAMSMQGDSHRMVRFFGFFYSVVYCLTGFMQLLMTSRILQKSRLLSGLLAYPVSMLIGVGFVFASSGAGLLGLLSVLKGGDVLRRSLHDPSVQVLYSPLKRRFRRMAITFVSGIAKPFTEAIAGVWILVGTTFLAPSAGCYLALPWLLLWIAVAPLVWWSFASYDKAAEQ